MTILTEDLIVKAYNLIEDEDFSRTAAAKVIGVSRQTLSAALDRKTFIPFWERFDSGDRNAGGSLQESDVVSLGNIRGEGVYIFTSAQNNTHVHTNWLKTLENIARVTDGEIIMSGFTYNKSGFQKSAKDDDDLWYDDAIKPYLCDEAVHLTDDLVFLGELNILPTAKNPLNDLDSYTRGKSAIVPHAKLQLKSRPRMTDGREAKTFYSTGAVTKLNYIQKRVGQIAEKQHKFSALIVEVGSDGNWFVRQITADPDTGYCYDLDRLYTHDGYESYDGVANINWGDIHIEKMCPQTALLQWGIALNDEGKYDKVCNSSLLDILKPETQMMNDTFDMSWRNHHNLKDPAFMFKQWHREEECVRKSIAIVADFLIASQRDGCQTVIVESNHDLALKKWMTETGGYKNDPVNAVYYLEMVLWMYKEFEAGNYSPEVFKHAVIEEAEDDAISDIRFLKEDESFIVEGIENGHHGHQGVDGARGSLQSFRQLGEKVNGGHVHHASILDDVWQSGVCNLVLGYNKGLSTWNISIIVTYPNGTRGMITIRNGEFRLT